MVRRTLFPVLLVFCSGALSCSRPAPEPAAAPAQPISAAAPAEATTQPSEASAPPAVPEAPASAVRVGDPVMLSWILRSSGAPGAAGWTLTLGAPLVYVDASGGAGTALGDVVVEPSDEAAGGAFAALVGSPVVVGGVFALREGPSGTTPAIADVMTVTVAASPDDPALLGGHVAEGSAGPPP